MVVQDTGKQKHTAQMQPPGGHAGKLGTSYFAILRHGVLYITKCEKQFGHWQVKDEKHTYSTR